MPQLLACMYDGGDSEDIWMGILALPFPCLSCLGSKMGLICLPLRGMPTSQGNGRDDAKKQPVQCPAQYRGSGVREVLVTNSSSVFLGGCRFRDMQICTGRCIYYRRLHFGDMLGVLMQVHGGVRAWTWAGGRHYWRLWHVGMYPGPCRLFLGIVRVCVHVAWGWERPVTWAPMKTISMTGKMSSICDLQWLWLTS